VKAAPGDHQLCRGLRVHDSVVIMRDDPSSVPRRDGPLRFRPYAGPGDIAGPAAADNARSAAPGIDDPDWMDGTFDAM
jgi:hypothetical protein